MSVNIPMSCHSVSLPFPPCLPLAALGGLFAALPVSIAPGRLASCRSHGIGNAVPVKKEQA